MTKNNNETLHTKNWQELLQKERSLQQAIACLRDKLNFGSDLSIVLVVMNFISDLYDLSIDEQKYIMSEEYEAIQKAVHIAINREK